MVMTGLPCRPTGVYSNRITLIIWIIWWHLPDTCAGATSSSLCLCEQFKKSEIRKSQRHQPGMVTSMLSRPLSMVLLLREL